MTIVLWVLVLAVVFVACRWSGAVLDHHYNDRQEVVAVLVVALCVLGPLGFGTASREIGTVFAEASLALSVAGGLLSGRRTRA